MLVGKPSMISFNILLALATLFVQPAWLASPPLLQDVRFDTAGTYVVFIYDRPTDRAGMYGRAPCNILLDAPTLKILQGNHTTEPMCTWTDDDTFYAELSFNSAVRPGSALAVRDVVAPKGYACLGNQSLCAPSVATVDEASPCGSQGCDALTVVIDGPSAVPACENVTVRLDALVAGGGSMQSTFAWRADVVGSDEAPALNAILSQLPSDQSTVDLSLPRGGSTFVLEVTATSKLLPGSAPATATFVIERTAAASPVLTIDGTRQQRALPSARLVLASSVLVASCWHGSHRVEFEWTHVRTVDTSSSEPLNHALALESTATSSLALEPFSLYAGRTYEFEVRAYMADDPGAATTARVSVDVLRENLRAEVGGTFRQVSVGAALELDASRSFDPNVPSAERDTEGTLSFAWNITRPGVDASATALGASLDDVDLASPVLTLTGALPVGAWAAAVTVSSGGASVTTAVQIEIVDASIPTITLAASGLPRTTQSADWDLPSERLAFATRLDEVSVARQAAGNVTWTYAWQLLAVSGDERSIVTSVDLENDTTSGAFQQSLAFRPGILAPGSNYVLQLTVNGGATPAKFELAVSTSRPPFGGTLDVQPSTGVAFLDTFRLRGLHWTAADEKSPLTYSFAFTTANDTNVVIRAPSASASSDAVFPAGHLTVTLSVRDALGAVQTAARSLSVIPADDGDAGCQELDDALRRAMRAVLRGAGDVAKQQVASLALGFPILSCEHVALAGELGWSTTTSVPMMMEVVDRADARLATAPGVRAHTANAVALLLRVDFALLSDAALVSGLQQADRLVLAARSTGVEVATLVNVFMSMDSVLSMSPATDAADRAIAAAVLSIASGLGTATLVGGVPGEEPIVAASPRVKWGAQREAPSALANSTLKMPGNGGRVEVPLGVFGGALGNAVQGNVDVVLYNFERNLRGDPALQRLGPIRTGVFSTTFTSSSTGGVIPVRDLADPLELVIPLQEGAAGSTPACHFWHEADEVWSTAGCTTRGISAAGELLCSCNHLTDFAGISIPTSGDELEDDAKSFNVNTLEEDDFEVLGDVRIGENPYIYGLVIGMSCACAVSVAALAAKDAFEARARERKLRSQIHVAPSRLSNPLAKRVKRFLRQSIAEDEHTEEELAIATRKAAALSIQRFTRGRMARKTVHRRKLLNPRRMLAHVKSKIQAEHTLLGLWFSDVEDAKRAELCQCFWSVAMVGLFVTTMLYDANPPPQASGSTSSVNLTHIFLASLITAAVCGPALALFQIILRWGYGRSSGSLDERIQGAIAKDQERDRAAAAHSFKKATAKFRRTASHQSPSQIRSAAPMPCSTPGSAATGAATSDAHRSPPQIRRAAPSAAPGAAPGGDAPVAAPSADVPSPAQSPAASHASIQWSVVSGVSFVAGEHNLDNTTLALLKRKFAKYDADSSGMMSISELGNFISDLGFSLSHRRVRDISNEMSANADGFVSFGELVAWYDGMLTAAALRDAQKLSTPWGRVQSVCERCTPPQRVRLALAWVSVWAIYVAFALLAIVFARGFGAAQTRLMLLGWGLSEVETLWIEEPIIIAIATCFALFAAAARADGESPLCSFVQSVFLGMSSVFACCCSCCSGGK